MTEIDRRNLLKTLFVEALDVAPDARAAWLGERCAHDPALKAELEALLTAHTRSDAFEQAVASAAESLLGGAPDAPVAGRRIGAYRIERELGRGGMGRVYLAERDDAHYAGRVAIKLLAPSAASRAQAERFRTETQVLADLEHPGIARLVDAGTTEDGDPYLVMEYVDGEPIDDYCDRAGLDVSERLALFARLCDAVEHAHRNLVVHRDIKASNVLVTADGKPKLLDFGIAKLLDLDRVRALELHLTADVSRLLTPTTASPEQLRGEPVTTATDVYALGHLLYRLLTGRLPYSVRDRFALPQAILHEPPERASLAARRAAGGASGTSIELAALRGTTPDGLARRLAGDLDTIVDKALRKRPEDRYATPRQLAEDIERHLEHRPIAARAESLGYVAHRFLRRHRAAVAGTVAALGLLVALTVFYTTRLATERDRAQVEARRSEEVAAFLTGLFEVATPDESRGAEVTAREMLDRGAERIGTELGGEPAVQAALMRVIGSAYGKLGLFEPATATLEQALAARDALAGPDDAVLGDALHELGSVLLAQARYDDAEALLLRALAVRRAVRGTAHGDVAATLRSLAALEYRLADYEAASAYLDEAEAIVRALDPGDELQLAEVLRARGDLNRRLGDYAGAIENQRRAAEIRSRVSGEDHPATLVARNNLSDSLNGAGRTREAETILRDILEIRRRVLPAGHEDVAHALTNLASSLKMQGRPTEAEPLQAEALAILRAAYPGDHPEVAIALNNLANLRHDLRDLDGALALHEESLAMNRRLFGEDHPSLADSYSNLAALLLDREDYPGALLMYRRTLELDRRALGEHHPFVGHDMTAIGVTEGLLGRLDAAEATLRAALEETRRVSGEDHPQTFNTMRELGIVLRGQGRCDEARPLLAAALPGLVAAFPGDPWETATARAHLGACLAASDPVEGERLMRAGYERLVEVHGHDGRLTRQARGLLADYLRAAGRDADAMELEPAARL